MHSANFFYLWNYHKMNQISTKGAKIVQNGPKLISSKCIKFVQKGTFEQISKICIKCIKTKFALNKSNWHKMNQSCTKWITFLQNAPNLHKVDQACAKWPKNAQKGLNFHKITKFAQNETNMHKIARPKLFAQNGSNLSKMSQI